MFNFESKSTTRIVTAVGTILGLSGAVYWYFRRCNAVKPVLKQAEISSSVDSKQADVESTPSVQSDIVEKTTVDNLETTV
jgi:hypothetical protein